MEILTTIATNGHWKEAARIPPPLGSLCFTTWNTKMPKKHIPNWLAVSKENMTMNHGSLGYPIFRQNHFYFSHHWPLCAMKSEHPRSWMISQRTHFRLLSWWTWISYRNFQPGGPNKRSSRWDFLPTLLMPSSGLGSHRSQDSIEIYCPLSCGSCEPHSCSAQEANEADVGGGWRRSEEMLLSTWPWRHAMPK